MKQTTLRGKLILLGKLTLTSPMIIGSGEKGNDIDISVLRDKNDKPYIPATSMAGVLRHYFYKNVDLKNIDAEQIKYFWGAGASNDKDICQSAMMLSDLTVLNNFSIKIRDGIKIDNLSGIAEDQKKYDYEVVEPGAVFKFKAEFNIREIYEKELFKKIIAFLVKGLIEEKVAIGAMTTKGFGRCKLSNYSFYNLNFENKKDVISWLSGEIEGHAANLNTNDTFSCKSNSFFIDSLFAIKNSLIIRSYTGDPDKPDAVHLESCNFPVLPATSVKGALRNRAQRIVNTLGLNNGELIKQFMGWADDQGKSGKKIKSRLVIEETPINNIVQEIQSRIKIDRFTGGVQKTALFDSMPLWPSEPGKEMVRVKFTINNYQDWEAGLMLLILKDLWLADLPLGGEKNIGRGVLQGIKAEIAFGDHYVSIKKEKSEHGIKLGGAADKLEGFVQALVSVCQGGGNTLC